MLIQNILNFLKTNKKISLYMIFIALFFVMWIDWVFANNGTATTSQDTWNSAEYLNGLVAIISTGIWMLSSIVGLFLNPGWTSGTGLGLHVQLKDLWIMISNVVYVIFAFLLIIIAFMNIIWKWDKWELKQALPRFVVWVLIVPFSWLFVQVVIAISSFLSVSVLMLPYDVLSNSPKSGWDEISKKPVCTTYVVVSKQKSWDTEAVNKSGCGWEESIWSLLTSNGIYWLMNIYTYWIFSLDELGKLNGNEISTFSSIFKIGMNLLIILLFAIVYFILMVSLCLALFVRWMWLWMYMIFSPVFGLLYFFDKSKDGFMDGKFSIGEFISLAMVPVYVSWALAFGLLFIFVAGTSFGSQSKTDSTGFIDYKSKTVNSENGSYSWSAAKITQGQWEWQRIVILDRFTLDMYGDVSTSGTNTDGLFDIMKSGFGTLLMQLFGLAVLWVAVMAAINQSKITQAVVEPIAAFGKQVGGLIQKSPQYAPIFGGQSMTSLKNASWTYAGSFQTAQSNKGAELAWKLPFANMWGGNEEIVKLWNNVSGTYQEVLPILDELRTKWELSELVTNGHAVESIKKQLRQYVEKGWVKNKDAAMEKINKIRVNDIESMKDAWDHIDWDATNPADSVLGWTVRATSAEIPDYFWSWAKRSQNVDSINNVLKVEDVSKDSVKLGTVLLTIKDWKIQDEADYKKIAIEFSDTNMVGWFSKEAFNKSLDRMWISENNKEDFINNIITHLHKDSSWEISVVKKWDGNVTQDDLFKDEDSSK